MPPPPDRLSYVDKPWFHNVTREQAIVLITERTYRNIIRYTLRRNNVVSYPKFFVSFIDINSIDGVTEGNYGNSQDDGYFLLRPSTTNVNSPLALVLWCRDRVYNIPVRKRSDNRYDILEYLFLSFR